MAVAALLCALALLCGLTWHQWGSLIVDCGREMYVPAVLSQGQRLYFDVSYQYGPLIPYWHALLFRIFGINLSVLYTAGIAIVAAITLLIYSLGRVFLPVSLSFAGGFVFLFLAFQLNLFNYVLPYSYPAAYGSLIFVMTLWLLISDCSGVKRWRIVAVGVLASAGLLTKVEIGLALYGLLACAIVIRGLGARSFSAASRDALICLPPFLAGLAVYGWLVSKGGAEFIFGDNIPVLPSTYFVKQFGQMYAEQVGFPMSSSRLAAVGALNFASVGVILFALADSSKSRRAGQVFGGAALTICAVHFAATFASRARLASLPPVLGAIAPLLFFNQGLLWSAVLLTGVALLHWRRSGQDIRRAAPLLLALATLALGLRVMARMEPLGYPIFYGVLAYLSWLVLLYTVARDWHLHVSPGVWRGLAAVLCCSIVALTGADYLAAKKRFHIKTERGSIYTDQRTGEAFSQVLSFLEGAKARSEVSVVMPEEAALYYFSETTAPSRWYIVIPGVLSPGEKTARYLTDLDRHDVRYVVLSNRSTPEYGMPIFGADYNREVYDWLQTNFAPVANIGQYERVARADHWGVLVYERKAASR